MISNFKEVFFGTISKKLLEMLLYTPSQIIRYSKNLGESKHFKFDQIYIIK